MIGKRHLDRRQALRLGLGGLLAAVGCDWQEALDLSDESQPAASAEEDRQPTSEELRSEAIRQGVASLTGECQRFAGGDWAKWSADLEEFRTALKAKIAAAKPNNPEAPGPFFEAREAVVEATGDRPLFESNPAWYLKYLLEPASIEPLRRELPIADVSLWLRQQGIDLLFVPVPKMTEVYAARVAQPCPESAVVAPHVRRLLLELGQRDVEVVDLLPRFLTAPEKDDKPLYLPDDPHWAPRAQEIAAKVICDRLDRYEIVRVMREGRRFVTAVDVPWDEKGAAYLALTADQQRRAQRAYPPSSRTVEDLAKVLSPTSPILVIGDSFCHRLIHCIALGLNYPIAVHSGGGQTTQAIKEAVRNPYLLQGRRAVVWVVCNTSLANPDWALPPAVTAASK